MIDFELILISAMRYALGRRSYIVNVIVRYILNELSSLSHCCKYIMLQDIKAQKKLGYGDKYDEDDWVFLMHALEESLAEDKII